MEFTPPYKHSHFLTLFSPNAKYVASYHLAQEGFTRLHPSNPIQAHEDGGQGLIILRFAATMDVLRVIEIRLFRDVLPTITEIGWSPDSTLLLAACSATGIIMVWSVEAEAFKAVIQVPGILTGSSTLAPPSSSSSGGSISPGSPGARHNKAHKPTTLPGLPGVHGPGASILRGVRFSADSRHVLVWEEHLLRMSVWSLESRRVCAVQHPKATAQSAVTSYSVPPFSTLGTTATTAVSQSGTSSSSSSSGSTGGGGGGGGGVGGGGGYAFSVRADLQYVAMVERRDCKDYVAIHATEHFWTRPAIHSFAVPELMDVEGVLWSPDGRYLVMWENPKMDYKVVVYSMEGRCHGVYQAQDVGSVSGVAGPVFMGVKSVCWHPGSKLFVVGGYDQKIRVLNYMTWTSVLELEHTSSINYGPKTVLWRESDTIATDMHSQGGVEYVKVEQPAQVPTVRIDIHKPNTKIGVGWCDFNCDGTLLASRNENMPNVLWIWSLADQKPVAIIQQQAAIRICRWDPSTPARIVWCCGTDRVYSWRADPSILGGDIEAVPVPAENFEVNSLRWCPEGGSLLLLDRDMFCLAYPLDENDQNTVHENTGSIFAGR
ncbi:WD repeat-containing protein wrap73 [Podila minutissima]|nr:WD repeat-containing protein wrap73 [Podila minutissima]